MFTYILKRIGFAIITLIIIIFVVYILVALFSDNPFFIPPGEVPPPRTTSEIDNAVQNSIRAHFLAPGSTATNRIPENVLTRFGYFVQSIFDPQQPFGQVFNPANLLGQRNIPALFFGNLRYTTIIVLPSFIVSSILGIMLGVFAGYKRGKILDTGINFFVVFFIALPSFILAPIAIAITFFLKVAPSRFLQFDTPGQSMQAVINSWITPIVVLTLVSLASYTSYTRNQVITVLTSNYVLIAKSKGLGKGSIFFKYVLRNISIPLASMLIPSYILLLSGSIVIEQFWNVPGSSRVIVQSFPNHEINIIMFNIVFFTALSIFTTILVDVSFVLLDPTIKYAQASQYNVLKFAKSYMMRKKNINAINQAAMTAKIGG
ncbi:ABC transporter permease [[Mycoplasma] testudinis]|uniref:ABC transporter permease n=1 Tax=[Mycoplasma] testudinis TaxID=33924 RepID=UPI000483F19F|nr:ABC transporter permease [[Mycoplasma] testudinis]